MNETDVVWVNLKVLSSLQPFQKLNTRSTHFQLQNTSAYFPEFVARWWIGANRESDMTRLKELYVAAQKHLETDKVRMIEHLKDSKKGLEALQKTYENDITTRAKIDWLIDNVNKMIVDAKPFITLNSC